MKNTKESIRQIIKETLDYKHKHSSWSVFKGTSPRLIVDYIDSLLDELKTIK